MISDLETREKKKAVKIILAQKAYLEATGSACIYY